MTSWILSIDKAYREHWDSAVEKGFWDLTKGRRGIRSGDYVYFWHSKHGLVGWVEATADQVDIDPLRMVPGPWSAEDKRKYVTRVEFVVRGQAEPVASWAQIKDHTGITVSPHLRPRIDDPAGEAYLLSLFGADPTDADPTDDDASDADPTDDDASDAEPYRAPDEDLCTHTERSIATRRGQQKFRRGLLDRYEGACAITGCTVESVLEAAHIDPFRGDDSHHLQNGLLLRADIHTLFDLYLLTIGDDYAVLVSPRLRNTEYENFNGTTLDLPADSSSHPNSGALQRHRTEFEKRHPPS
ncbi:hypothetical protein GCM10010528_22770 [Gordonia defluvii]|uniref:HNH nuclease domain-containing protein n=1 Tax=Gordonia defluvii TaxID=283718 RepID=A0ABP6LID1_9ACTN